MSENIEQVLAEEQPSSPIPLEEQISLELVKQNYTEAKLKEFEEYLKLDIIDNDKESYITIKDKRKEVKSYRVAVEKFCKFKREDAVKVQKAWVAQENKLVEKLAKVEDYLKGKEDAYDKAIAKEKADKARKIEEQWIMRQAEITKMGAMYSDGNFILGEVSFEMSSIKECEVEIWIESILPKFKEEHQRIEAERIRELEIQQEREAELIRRQAAINRKQKELEEQEAKLKQAQEEQERKQREEEEKKAAEAREKLQAKWGARIKQLTDMGLTFDFNDDHYKGYSCFVSVLDIKVYDDEKWSRTIDDMTAVIAYEKEKEEQKRLAEIEAQKEAERKMTLRQSRRSALRQYTVEEPEMDLAEYTDEAWEQLLKTAKDYHEECQRKQWEKEQEEKRKQEEQKKADELLQASEKQKWADIISQVSAIEIHEFKSGQYRKRAIELRKLLDQIKAL